MVSGCDVSWIAVASSGAALAGQRVIMSRLAVKCKDSPSWKLDKGSGDRSYTQKIKFAPVDSFTQVPLVFMGFSLLDVVNEDDYRLSVAATSVDRTGLDLVLSTWGDTHVWSTHVSWMVLDESYLRTQDVQVAVGRIPFKKTLPQYRLHEGSGNRLVQQPVLFPKKFAEKPSVLPALSVIDLLRDTPPRLRLRPTSVGEAGAVMELSATEKGHVWGASCCWLAHAPAPSDHAGGKKAKIVPQAAARMHLTCLFGLITLSSSRSRCADSSSRASTCRRCSCSSTAVACLEQEGQRGYVLIGIL